MPATPAPRVRTTRRVHVGRPVACGVWSLSSAGQQLPARFQVRHQLQRVRVLVWTRPDLQYIVAHCQARPAPRWRGSAVRGLPSTKCRDSNRAAQAAHGPARAHPQGPDPGRARAQTTAAAGQKPARGRAVATLALARRDTGAQSAGGRRWGCEPPSPHTAAASAQVCCGDMTRRRRYASPTAYFAVCQNPRNIHKSKATQ